MVGTDDFDWDVENLGNKIAELSIKNVRQLCRFLEEKHQIAAQFVVQGNLTMAAGTFTNARALEDYSVILTGYPPNLKITCIKAIREVTGWGLKEAKDFSEALPGKVVENVSKEKAEEVLRILRAAGSTARME